jgi:hypothetical protein
MANFLPILKKRLPLHNPDQLPVKYSNLNTTVFGDAQSGLDADSDLLDSGNAKSKNLLRKWRKEITDQNLKYRIQRII